MLFKVLHYNVQLLITDFVFLISTCMYRLQDSLVNLSSIKTESKRLEQTIVELEATNQVRLPNVYIDDDIHV